MCLMWYDSAIKDYADLNYQINKLYCDNNGYDIHSSSEKVYTDRTPHWERLPLLLKYLEKSQYEYLVWIDADAHFYIGSSPIEQCTCKYSKYDFIFSKDVHHKGIDMPNTSGINTGIFIIKNTPYSKDFLTKWAYDVELYESYNKNPKKHWNDQGVLRDMYNKNLLDIQQKCITLPYGILQHFDEIELKKFKYLPVIHHLAGRNNRYTRTLEYYNKIKLLRIIESR